MSLDIESLVGENLLSDQDKLDAFKSWFDLEVTFFEEFEATFIKRDDIEPINNDDRDESTEEIRIHIDKVYVIPDKTDTDAENLITRNGSSNFTESVMYVFGRTMSRAGLLDEDGNALIKAEQDTVEFDGKVYDIFGINRVGAFAGTYVLFKFQIRFEFKRI